MFTKIGRTVCYRRQAQSHQVLNVPKSDVEIAKGMKSRDKLVVVHTMAAIKDADEHIKNTKNALRNAIAK